MNGAESLVRTLIDSGIDLCVANPGTSEMHFVAALDKVPGMRCVLGLFEGVVTGAADGFYRMADRPAATLLHLGPGLANGLANLHNAKKARSGIVNIVGEHATYHLAHDAPLTSDVAAVARPMSDWVRTSASSREVAADGALAVEAARTAPGQIATLILPADTAWNEADGARRARAPTARAGVAVQSVRAAAQALRARQPCALLLGGIGVREDALQLAGRIAAKTGCAVLSEFNSPRLQRGAGRVATQRVPYVVDSALAMLGELRQIVLVGAKAPVSFFAYPGKPSLLAPPDCAFTTLAGVDEDIIAALDALADELGARTLAPAGVAELAPPPLPEGPITLDGVAAVLGALIPRDAIVVDEAVSSGRGLGGPTQHAQPHDWLTSMGGSIGYGLPVAVGAALACPSRKVIALEGDGSAMYTLQALWTMARESLDVTVVVFANRAYQILRGEFANVGAGAPGQRATDMLTLDRPALDWCALARGHGVESGQASDLAAFAKELRRGLACDGPYLIEVRM
ncbi:MAG: acetolactate synthase large subunit [Rubrivivax sp.]